MSFYILSNDFLLYCQVAILSQQFPFEFYTPHFPLRFGYSENRDDFPVSIIYSIFMHNKTVCESGRRFLARFSDRETDNLKNLFMYRVIAVYVFT